MEINITLTPAEVHLLDHIGTETPQAYLERVLHAALVRRTDYMAKFEARIDKSGDCWLWTGGKTPAGYGNFRNPETNRSDLAHRISYRMYRGPIPAGMILLHSCDVPSCVHPAHLTVGTHLDNNKDMWKKGRNPKSIAGNTVKGENHSSSKLTQKQVDEIKKIHLESKTPSRALGEMFGVSSHCILRILSGKTWV